MRYSTQSRERKYIKEYGSLSFARKCCDKYDKKLMDTAIKTINTVGMDAAKTTSKRVKKTADRTVDLIGNKIFNKPKK